jgi:hypothetical protein
MYIKFQQMQPSPLDPLGLNPSLEVQEPAGPSRKSPSVWKGRHTIYTCSYLNNCWQEQERDFRHGQSLHQLHKAHLQRCSCQKKCYSFVLHEQSLKEWNGKNDKKKWRWNKIKQMVPNKDPLCYQGVQEEKFRRRKGRGKRWVLRLLTTFM